MNPEESEKLTTEEILEEQKKLKSSKTITAVLIGLFIGIAVYSTIKNGFGFFTFFPLVFVFLLINNRKKGKALTKELQSRI